MAKARVDGGWLTYSQLDFGHPIDGAFAIGYRLIDNQNERWSRRFRRVKDGIPSSRKAAQAVLGVAIAELMGALQWDGKDVTFTPAVRSKETTASTSGTLSILAQHCASQCNGRFLSQLLSKQPHESLHVPPKKVPERRAILEAASFTASNVNTPYVIVVDDLITSGLTLSYSARAIKNQNPQTKVYGLALGKHEYLSNFDDADKASPNDHIPAKWAQLWQMHDGG